MALKQVQMAVYLNNYSFCRMHMLTLFCIKTNLRENRFFAARWAMVDENGTHNVKFLAKNCTKVMCNKHAWVCNGTESMYTYERHLERLQGMLPRTMGTASWKRRSNLPSTRGFQFVETAWNNFHPSTFWHLTAFCHRQMGQNFIFLRIFVWHVVHGRGVYLGFTAQRHKTPLNL